MINLDYFINERTKLLFIIKDHLIDIDGQKICPMNQEEIAKYLGCSKVKTNNLLHELIEGGYVETPKKGRYSLTSLAINIIDQMEEKANNG